MDHSYIDEHNIVARYEMGRLSEDECAGFEEHFVDCAQCQQLLTAAESFREGLQTVSREDAVNAPLPSKGWIGRLSPSAWMSWGGARMAAAASVILIAGSAVFLLRDDRLARREADLERLAAVDWQRRYEDQQRADMEKRVKPPVQPVNSTGAFGADQPQVVYKASLITVRSAGSRRPDIVNVARAQRDVLLVTDLFNDLHDCRATLSDASGQPLWRSDVMRLFSTNQAISVPLHGLKPGNYTLIFETQIRNSGSASTPAADRFRTAAYYPFQLQFR